MGITLNQLTNTVSKVMAKIKDKYVPKENDKGLSTNDYTNEDKNKVAKIDTIENSIEQVSSQIDEKAKLLNARMDTFTKLEEGSTTADAELADGRVGIDGTIYENIGGAIRNQLNNLKEDLSNTLKVKTKTLEIDNMINLATITTACGLENGVISTADKFASYMVTNYEFAKPQTIYSAWRYKGESNITLFSVACYDKYKKYIGDASYLNSKKAFTTLDNTYYVRICSQSKDFTESISPSINEGETFSIYLPYRDEWVETVTEYVKKEELDLLQSYQTDYVPTPTIVSANSMIDGETLTISEISNSKQNNIISFTARISEFSSVKISHSEMNYRSGIIIVDNTKVEIYDGTTLKKSSNHGISISDRISITISVKRNQKADIVVSSGSGYFILEDVAWNGCKDDIIATSIGSTFINCELSYCYNDLKNDIWGFGDSYYDMWVNVVNDWGYTNWLVDGFSGRSSSEAIKSFRILTTIRKPKTILWSMGMNDADSSTDINTSWKTAFDYVKSYCDKNKVELIGFTIPNVPDRNHNFKNDYIKANCKRIIDINHVVGADISTEWYDGLLHSDKVHPSSIGRRVIAQEVIKIVPELYH